MSAWMTTPVHRSALVQAAIVYDVIDPISAQDLYRDMWYSNMLALHHRYGDTPPDEVFFTNDRTTVEAPLDINVIILNINCWEYQCAEYEGYDIRWSAAVMNELRDKLLAKAGFDPGEDGMDLWYKNVRRHMDMPWGIHDWDEVMADAQALHGG